METVGVGILPGFGFAVSIRVALRKRSARNNVYAMTRKDRVE